VLDLRAKTITRPAGQTEAIGFEAKSPSTPTGRLQKRLRSMAHSDQDVAGLLVQHNRLKIFDL
jgi:hypothetical protein